MSFAVREAASEDLLGVRRVLDAAMLDVRDDLRERIESGDVLVASEVRNTSNSRAVSSRATRGKARKTSEASLSVKPRDDADDSPVLGALVLVPRERGGFDTGHERDGFDTGHERSEFDTGHDRDGFDTEDDGARVDAVAVRRARRGQGIGALLVEAASERHPQLTAEFDADVRPFYESLGFEIEPVEGGTDRFRGRYEGESE